MYTLFTFSLLVGLIIALVLVYELKFCICGSDKFIERLLSIIVSTLLIAFFISAIGLLAVEPFFEKEYYVAKQYEVVELKQGNQLFEIAGDYISFNTSEGEILIRDSKTKMFISSNIDSYAIVKMYKLRYVNETMNKWMPCPNWNFNEIYVK